MAQPAPGSLTNDVIPVESNLENETNANDFKCADKPTKNIKITKTEMEQKEDLKSKTQHSIWVQDAPQIAPLFTVNNEDHAVIEDVIPAANQDVSKVSVCHSCQHLYDKTSAVVLTPSTLCHTHNHVHAQHQTSFLSSVKPWKARRYEDLCACSENGSECRCNNKGNQTSLCLCLLPRNAPWWPRTKIILLIIAGIMPWAFLVVYLVYTFKVKNHDMNP